MKSNITKMHGQQHIKTDGKNLHWNLSVIMAIKRLHMLSNYTAWAKEKFCLYVKCVLVGERR